MIDLADIKQMVTQTDEHTLTLYLNVDNAVDENQAENPAWRIWMKNKLNELDSFGKRQTASWDGIRGRTERFFENYQSTSKGLVFFAGADYEQVFELPMATENQGWFGRAQIAPLLWLLDEYEPYLIVLVDQEKARFFVAQLGSIGFREGLEVDIEGYDFGERTIMSNPGPGIDNGSVHGGTGKEDFQNMLDEHRTRMYRQVAGAIETYVNQRHLRRYIIGGSEQAAHAVHNLLPQKLADACVAITNIPMRLSTNEILEQVQPKAIEHERQEEMHIVQETIDFAKASGRGALGMKAVMEALEMQRVELLILPWSDVEADGLRTDLPLRVFASGGSVELVHGEAADLLKREGGIAARLYYAL